MMKNITEVKITAQMLLSMCLGCDKCGGLYKAEDKTICIVDESFDKGRELYWLQGTEVLAPFFFTSRKSLYKVRDLIKICNLDNLKDCMRANFYKYNV
jgi:hypothetical protein